MNRSFHVQHQSANFDQSSGNFYQFFSFSLIHSMLMGVAFCASEMTRRVTADDVEKKKKKKKKTKKKNSCLKNSVDSGR
jgi:uncharacterized membrane protein